MDESRCSKLLTCLVFLSALFASPTLSTGQNGEPYNLCVRKANIPDFMKEVFTEKKMNDKYEVSFHIDPFYLLGDFNGDNRNDSAILIKDKMSGKIGIAIIHDGKRDIFIVGAGNAFGNGGPDFSWLDVWSIHPKGTVQAFESQPVHLVSEGLSVGKAESASGLIYWHGKKYKLYQLAD